RRSSNIEDRRGLSPGPAAGGGLLLRLLPLLIRSRVGRWVLVAGVAVFVGARLLGIDLLPLLGVGMGAENTARPARAPSAEEQELADFVAVVLADTEDTWEPLFASLGRRYQHPTLVLFSDRVNSACGMGSAAMGPFYCPADQRVYIDLAFYRDLKERHGAPGDFAQAYVIAHEVGHHGQTLPGISAAVHAARGWMPRDAANGLALRQELQADCFPCLWGHHGRSRRQRLESGAPEGALAAAGALGADPLQSSVQGTVPRDRFTHGT